MRIPLSQPDIGEREIEYVTNVLRSGHLSLGPRVTEFWEAFAEYLGTRYAVATNSGTSALHLCSQSSRHRRRRRRVDHLVQFRSFG